MSDSSATPRRHEAIVRDLLGAIVSGSIPPAARVPFEHELVERYAVSRTVAREALQRLAGYGLIQVRRRAGAVVTPPGSWNMLEPAVLDAALAVTANAEFYAALFEARLMIEPEAAALAAARINADALQRLQEALDTMGNAPNPKIFMQADLLFHTGILDATGNWVLRQFAGAIRSALLASIRLTHANSPSLHRAADLHTQVLDAITVGDGARARHAMAWLLTTTRLEVEHALQRKAS